MSDLRLRMLPVWVAAVLMTGFLAVHAVLMSGWYGIGWDAHAYYVAWDGGLYEALPGAVDAYNYSPLFAQVIWPLTLLPWPVFCGLLLTAAGVGIAWLVKPLSPAAGVLAWLACLPEILSGNVFWLLAVMAVVGAAHGSAWCFAAFTKISPCLGPVWFLVRREWRMLAGFTAGSLVLLALSVAISPAEWSAWIHFLGSSAGANDGRVYLTPAAFFFPLVIRLPMALALTVFAARANRRALIPVAMLLASPVVGWGTFALLAAVPRLRSSARAPAVPPQVASPPPSSLTR